MGLRVGVVGATGLVGRTILAVLLERGFPVEELRVMSSPRSAGTELEWGGERHRLIDAAAPGAFDGLDVALFSAGATASRALAPIATAAGVVVVDNSSAWRLDPAVPLVVPEVNPGALREHRGIIANPNCCAIPLTVVLNPISALSPLRRVVVDTYQAASGKGWKLVEELDRQRRALVEGGTPAADVYPHVLEGNVVPGGWPMDREMAEYVQPVYEDPQAAFAYNQEELKVIAETRKILELPTLAIACTTVRVPVRIGHSEAVWIETEATLHPDTVREALFTAPGVIVHDDPGAELYPLALDAVGRDEVLVGRVRRDLSHPTGLALWLASDNLRKGAATNAVQVAELLTR
jgi:aspartate-semialdehyde dehydrogenase